jgi:major capsid protein E
MEKLEIYGMNQVSMTKVVNKINTDVQAARIGLQFFPWENSATEEITWDIVKAASPLANFKSMDGESEIRGKRAFAQGYASVVCLSQKERFNASDLRKLREAGMLPVVDGVASMAAQQGQAVKKKITKSLTEMKIAIDNRVEWMQINALLGKIEYDGKVSFDVDFAIPGDQTGLVPDDLWSDAANSTPIADIQGWKQSVRDEQGLELDTIIMSSKSLHYIALNEELRTTMQYTNPLFSDEKTKQLVENEVGVSIMIYDAKYTDEQGDNLTRFLPEAQIIMIASKSKVGVTFRIGHAHANYVPGHYTWQETKTDPYGLEVGVGLDAFPAVQSPETLLNATVF